MFSKRVDDKLEHKFVIGSITYAIRGRDILRNHGFKARVERKTSEYKSGCGYAVVFEGDLETAERILKNANIKITKTI